MVPRIALYISVCSMLFALPVLGQPETETAPAPTPAPMISIPAVTPTVRSTETLSYVGTVMANYENRGLLLKTEDKYIVVYLTDDQQKMGVARGNNVSVKGQIRPDSLLGNEIMATDLSITSKDKPTEGPIMILPIENLAKMSPGENLIATKGSVNEWSLGSLTLRDGSDTFRVDLGRADPYNMIGRGEEIAVIGQLQEVQHKPSIKAIWIRPASVFARPNEPKSVQTVYSVLKADERGKLVRVKGRIGLYIGSEITGKLLYEDKNVLIVYPSEKYLSLDAPSGSEVVVVGTYDAELHKGKSYGVLKDARIDRIELAQIRQQK